MLVLVKAKPCLLLDPKLGRGKKIAERRRAVGLGLRSMLTEEV